MRKISFVLGIIGLSLIFFMGGYLFNRQLSLQKINRDSFALINNSLINRFQEPATLASTLPATPTGIFKISGQDIAFPSVSDHHDILYYDRVSGNIRSLDITAASNQKAKTIATIKPGARRITWAANNKRILADYANSSIYYDLENSKSKEYSASIQKPALSKKGDALAYIFSNNETGESNISLTDTNLESFKNIFKTQTTNWDLTWLNEDQLSLSNSLGRNSSSIFTLNTRTKEFQNIINALNIIDISWSPNGQSLIYSRNGDNGLELDYINLPDTTPRVLGLQAHARQCAWSIDNKTLICALQDQRDLSNITIVSLDASDSSAIAKTIFQSSTASLNSLQKVFLNNLEDYLMLLDNSNNLYAFHL